MTVLTTTIVIESEVIFNVLIVVVGGLARGTRGGGVRGSLIGPQRHTWLTHTRAGQEGRHD